MEKKNRRQNSGETDSKRKTVETKRKNGRKKRKNNRKK